MNTFVQNFGNDQFINNKLTHITIGLDIIVYFISKMCKQTRATCKYSIQTMM